MTSTQQRTNTKILVPRTGNMPSIRQPALVCLICKISDQALLRDIKIYIHREQFGIVAQIRDCFGINLPEHWIRNLHSMRICTSCRTKLNKAVEFRSMIEKSVNSECSVLTEGASARTTLVIHSTLAQDGQCQRKRSLPPESSRIAKKFCPRSVGEAETEFVVDVNPSIHSYNKNGAQKEDISGMVDCTQNRVSLGGEEGLTHMESPKYSLISAAESEHSYCAESLHEQAESIGMRSFKRLRDFVDAKKTSLDLVERCKLISVLRNCDNSECDIALAIMASPLMKAIEAAIINDVSSVISHLCSYNLEPGPSVLRKVPTARNLELQQEELLVHATLELAKAMPFVMDVLVTMCSSPMPTQKNLHRVVGLIYGVAMHSRQKNLAAVQKVNTLVVASKQTNYELLKNLSKLGITLADHSKITAAQKNLGGENFPGENGMPLLTKKLLKKQGRRKYPAASKAEGKAARRDTTLPVRPNREAEQYNSVTTGQGEVRTASGQLNSVDEELGTPEASQPCMAQGIIETVEETVVLDDVTFFCVEDD